MNPEPGKVFLSSLPVGASARLWDGSVVRVEVLGSGGVVVSFGVEREIFGKVIHSRHRHVIARQTNVVRVKGESKLNEVHQNKGSRKSNPPEEV